MNIVAPARRRVVATATAFGRKRRHRSPTAIAQFGSSFDFDDNDSAGACSRSRRQHSSTTATAATDVTSADADPDDRHNPLTNGGTIKAVFIFHRHGDRAPNRYLGAPHYLDRESEHWYGRIPQPPGAAGSVHDELSRYFPPEIHESQNGGRYLDVGREPFGFLTFRGMDQMREVGGGFRRRYERFGHRVGGNATTYGEDDNDDGYSLLDHWNVRAYSTNYLRTVMSVQCFLDGLIGKQCPSKNKNKIQQQDNRITWAGGGLKRYYKDMGKYEQMAHDNNNMGGASTWTTKEDLSNVEDGTGTVRVQVRDKEIDTLNAFDRHPEMMNGFVKDVLATERFQRIDGAAKPLAETLSTYLPGLLGAPQAFGGTPSGINWIHANDHFVCRRAHSIPLLAFSDYEEGGEGNGSSAASKKEYREAEAALTRLAVPVCSHLSWRFREWYRNPKLLSAVAVPPFREMMEIMTETANTDGGGGLGGGGLGGGASSSDRRPFVLYSCHDVTLLALLYAIGADFLVSGEDCGGKNMPEEKDGPYSSMHIMGSARKSDQQTSWRWWPAYSSTIAFELVRLDDDDESQSAGTEEQYAIRVVLNGDAVRLIPRMTIEDEGLLEEQTLCSRQVFGEMSKDGRRANMMKLSDFEQVIKVLEETGDRRSFFSSVEDDNPDMRAMDKIGVDGG